MPNPPSAPDATTPRGGAAGRAGGDRFVTLGGGGSGAVVIGGDGRPLRAGPGARVAPRIPPPASGATGGTASQVNPLRAGR